MVDLLADRGRVAGVEAESPDRTRRPFNATLVVAADGRDSAVARLARAPARVRPHNRFVYFAYWRGVRTPKSEARVWLLDPDAVAVFPNEDDVTVVAAVPHKVRLPEFRADPEAAYRRLVDGLPDGPELASAERVSKLLGKLEMPNKMRGAARKGIAFIGDAALATDPLFGVGCGWAFQSAEWLVKESRSALLDHGDVDAALERYRRVFRRRLALHHMQITDYSTGRAMRLNERVMFRRAAAADPFVARGDGGGRVAPAPDPASTRPAAECAATRASRVSLTKSCPPRSAWAGSYLLRQPGGFEGLAVVEVVPVADALAVLELGETRIGRVELDSALFASAPDMAQHDDSVFKITELRDLNVP